MWEDHPELVLNEFGHLFLDEGGVLVRGAVASSFDALVLLLTGPSLGVASHRDSLISPCTKEGSSRVIDSVQLEGQVGRPSELVCKGFPGGRQCKVSAKGVD